MNGSSTETSRRPAVEIRPLTHLTQTGELYYRRPEVERQIAEALIFQKLAASSFVAVRRRLLILTLHEAVMRERDMDIDGRLALNEEAKTIIREEFNLSDDCIGRGEVERVMADLKVKLLRKLDENELALIEPMLNRGIQYRVLAPEQGGISTRLLTWVETMR